MIRSLVLGAVLGGVVAFAWSAVSWTLLPWHDSAMKSFTDEAAVAQVLRDNIPSGGMFMLPGPPPGYDRMSKAEKEAAEAAMAQKRSEGPYLHGVVWRRVRDDMGRQMGVALLFDVLSALLVTMLVMRTGGMTWGGRVMFVVTMALAACMIAVAPNWIWWHHPADVVIVQMADLLIGWLLAGMVIAKVAAPKAA
ncbi:MAG: hypothetical protein ACRENJ_00515 [Candidatus Eiseniibacteriota bacterium]